VEDGPTITHGGMSSGAGYLPRRRPAPRISSIRSYPRLRKSPRCLPLIRISVGFFRQSDMVLPDWRRSPRRSMPAPPRWWFRRRQSISHGWSIDKPVVRVRYEYAEDGTPALSSFVDGFSPVTRRCGGPADVTALHGDRRAGYAPSRPCNGIENRLSWVEWDGMWRGGSRPGMSVAAPFVWRCLSGSTIAPLHLLFIIC
jgi:hypothetical protein